MSDSGLTWVAIAGVVSFVATLIGLITVLLKGAERFTKAEGALEVAHAAEAKADKATADLATFKERVARDYATAAMVATMESKVVEAINRLGDRLDRVFEARGQP